MGFTYMVLLEVLIKEDDPECLFLRMTSEREKKQFKNFMKKLMNRAESKKNIKAIDITRFIIDVIKNVTESGVMVKKKDIRSVIGIIGFVETNLDDWRFIW